MSLWGGRFSDQPDDALRALNDSIGFDQRMYREDIAGSIAYARAIAEAGVITGDEAHRIVDGLQAVLAEFEAGIFAYLPGDEDIHTAVERRLIEMVGPVGGKLHTGRSRNDQVATDLRLWTMNALKRLDGLMDTLQRTIIEQGTRHVETLMPGYTHMQPAQAITAGHWLMSFFWMLARDRERLADAWRRTAVMPLGSGALAGTPLPIDRDKLATELGFTSCSHNSLDSVSDRDFVTESCACLTTIAIHISRLGEDIVFYSNPAFGFISLNEKYSTGSSLMPQKRNADPMELARGKAGRLIGNLTGLLSTFKSLPSGYNKDLQEDKEPLFDSVDTLQKLLSITIAIIETLDLDPDAMRAALDEDMLATDIADYLVRKGIPFREAHHITGQIVQLASKTGRRLSELSIEEYQRIHTAFTTDIYDVFSFEKSVASRSTSGGTAPAAVRQQITHAKAWLETHNASQELSQMHKT